ncbi:MAG: TonB-dependent receptor [Chitinophagaceae bacterium]
MKIKKRKGTILMCTMAALILSMSVFGQSTIKGTLRSPSKEPLPGATITVKGTKKTVVTDVNGNFSLDAPVGSTLLITSVGFEDREVKVTSSNIDAVLDQKNNALSEVVVTGYSAQKKESLTGAISTVTAKDLDRVHGGSTVSSGLAGKLPGVSFRMPDGRPGASATIQIRNMGNPLYVIDGIQQDAVQFNNLAPNDIESITVLKDASAAIYGVRAANGVVVVTTKKGKVGGKNSVNVDAYAGMQNWTRFAEVLNDSYTYMTMRAEGEMNGTARATAITPAELEKYKAGTEAGYKSFDWRDFIIKKNAPQNSVNINATGGSDKINYYLSATNLFQNSVLGREYKFNRTNIQSNLNAQISDRIKVGVAINGRIETRQNPGVPGGDDYNLARFAILRNTPLERPYANDNPTYLNDIKHNETNWAYLNTTYGGKYKDDWRVLQTNFNAEYRIPGIEGLSVKGVYSYYLADELYNNHEYTYVTYTYNPADNKYQPTGGSTNPFRERVQRKVINKAAQLQGVYNNTFGNHTVGATFVAERISNQNLRNRIHSVPSTNVLPLIYFNRADIYEDSDDREARIGYIGRVNYSFSNRYYLEISARRDASYLFAPDKRVGYFPAVSGGWRLTNEKFLENQLGKIFTDLKLRASYGLLGDDRLANGNPVIAPFSYLEGYNYNTGTGILGGNAVVGSRDRGLPVRNVTWFKSKITDIGLDFSLLKGKLTGTFDYFYRKRTGLLAAKYDVLVPSEVGYTLPQENVNSDAQYGEEGSLNYNDKAGAVSYSVGVNASYSRAKTLQTYKPIFFNSIDKFRNAIDQRYGNVDWGKIVDGQFSSFDQINSWPVNIDGQGNRTLLPGDLIIRDINNDGKIDNNDNRPIGYGSGTQPNINYGLNFGLGYKGFDFHADFSGGAGFSWYQENETRRPFQNDGNLNTIFLDRWHRADMYDLNSTWIPGKYPANRFNQDNSNNFQQSTFWGHNVKYLRARTLEVGYSVPPSILDRVKIQKVRIYLNAYNLFSIDNIHALNIDPEVTTTNGYQFPQNKFINAGINLSL